MVETTPTKPTSLTKLTAQSLFYGTLTGTFVYTMMVLDQTYKLTNISILQCTISALITAFVIFLLNLLQRQKVILDNPETFTEQEIVKQEKQMGFIVTTTIITVTVTFLAPLVAIIIRTF
jgi:hypothetical protein